MATIKICDVCKSQDEVTNCAYWVDRRMDAAGSMDDEYDSFDLCIQCRLNAAMKVIKKLCSGENFPERIYGPMFSEVVRNMLKK
jgi:hypothetical protein